ncbi:M15 family metallopeptidase [Synechococcus sp. MIT S9503]|uniref:M15 family metallopeptidase n=1 Tax=Synechococcus sp. MIT S9503 TaxID=3082547 RepID=UPI0039A72DA1
MSRAVVTRSRKRDSSRDDIPVARRSRSSQPKRGGGLGLLIACGTVFSISLATVLFIPDLLPFTSRPQIVEGIDEQPGRDGRLLGHFPYPEAEMDELVPVEPGVELHRDAAIALDAMRRAAAADGIDLRLLSGYRSQQLQKSIFFDVKSERNQTAAERAKVSAPPGYSEHSTGYAVDLGDGADPASNLSEFFEQTAAFSWLQDHAASYHYTLSFPAVNSQGVSYEPWHWRFEGSAEALRRFEPARRLASGR